MALKELQIRYATKRAKGYKLTNGEGLYLLVRPNGSKLWRMTYRYGGKEKLLSFGAHPAVSRAAPWPKWCWARGGDPSAGNKPRAQMTRKEAARKWHGHRLDALDAGHATRLPTRLQRDAFPVLGTLGLGVIAPAGVLAMVRWVEARGALDVRSRSRSYRAASARAGGECDHVRVLNAVALW